MRGDSEDADAAVCWKSRCHATALPLQSPSHPVIRKVRTPGTRPSPSNGKERRGRYVHCLWDVHPGWGLEALVLYRQLWASLI